MEFDYRHLLKREVACPICAGTNFLQLATNDRYRMGVRTVGCLCCGLVLTNPQPTEAALSEFYAKHYRRIYRKTDRPTPEYIKRLGIDERAKYTAAFLNSDGLFSAATSVVDVGCAEGTLLREVRECKADLKLVGVEPNPMFAKFAKEFAGVEVFDDLHSQGLQQQGPFDLVIANHVLEHVQRPIEFLRRIVELLAPGGCVYIDVPDVTRYASIADLHVAHLYHFSVETLMRLTAATGFCVVHIERHNPPHHPRSIRAVLRYAGDQPQSDRTFIYPVSIMSLEEFKKVQQINQTAWRFFLRMHPCVRPILWCTKRVISPILRK